MARRADASLRRVSPETIARRARSKGVQASKLPSILLRGAANEAEFENRLTLAEALEDGLARLPIEEGEPPDIAALLDQLGEA
ncbi:MAG: hypothetical protein AB7J28_09815 [Hyphomonadaceae bacterium]